MSFVTPSSNYRILPATTEIDDPFRVDPFGSIAQTSDPFEVAKNHIIALLMTNPGERLMRPTYGAGVGLLVFGNNDPFVIQQLSLAVQRALQQWEPTLTMVTCDVVSIDPYNGLVNLRIAFTLNSVSQVHQVEFTFNGTGVEV